MISIENGKASIEGKRIDIISEFMVIAEYLVEKDVMNSDQIQLYTFLATASEEDKKKFLKKAMEDFDDFNKLLDLMRILL